jgi:hypothetical protein
MLSRAHVSRFVLAATLCIAPVAMPGLLFAPSVAHADATSDLAKAEQAYSALDYPTANATAQAVLQKGDLPHDELVRATRILALSSVAMDKPAEAKDAFVLLLTYDPTYTVDPKLGPRYREPFNEAKGYWAAQSGKPGLESSVMVSPRAPGSIRVTTRDPSGVVKRIIVSYRWAPAKTFVQAAAKTGESHVDVPAPPAGSTRLDYFVRAEDAAGSVAFENGSASSPRFSVVQAEATRADAKEGRSVFASPIFWIITGVIVAGGATAAVLLATQKGDTTTVVSNKWTPALGCGGGSRCE